MADVNTIADYIRRRAMELGIDPNTALGIARFEGLNPNTLGAPTFGNPDAKGYSFGPFQLYSASPDPTKIAPGGLAYEFKEKYGAAPSRENWQQQVDFSLETMKNRGTSPWYAVRDQGGIDAITQKGAEFARTLGTPAPAPIADAASPPDAGASAGGILGGLSGLASAIGGLLGGGNQPAPMDPQMQGPPMPPQPQPVYANDIGTNLRRIGNSLAPEIVDPAKPLTEQEIAEEKSRERQLARIGEAQKGASALIAAGAPRETQAAAIPTPETRPIAFAPLKRYRTLREIRGLLG
jgi:hypothetical protein